MKVVAVKPEDVMLTLSHNKYVYCTSADGDFISNLYYEEVNYIFEKMENDSLVFFTIEKEDTDDE